MGHVKGLALIGAIKALRHQREQAEPRLAEHLRSYLDDRIFPSRWYPEEDLLALLEVLVALMPARPDVWEWLGMQGADGDFRTVYSAFVRVGRPDMALARYPRIWRLYHDNGVAKVEIAGSRAVVTVHSDLAHLEEFCRLQAGHMQRLLELSGARDVQVTVVRREADGEPAQWDLRWLPPD